MEWPTKSRELDEKCYLEFYQPRSTRPAIKKKAKV